MKKESQNNLPKMIVILGQTATGKSALAVRLAKKYGGEIISADSRQVFRGLNLGTGKITKESRRGVPHHLLDIANPKQQFSVAEYQRLFNQSARLIERRGKIPILCGGTGFYIDTVIDNRKYPEVPPNTKLRKQLLKKSAPELFSILKKLDPKRAKIIDAKNSVRLVRAIEIAQKLGRVPMATKKSTQFSVLKIGVTLPEPLLRKRIEKRLRERLGKGMVREARRLHTKGLSYARMEALGLEYRFLAKFLQRKISQKELLSELTQAIWQYAKRQKTWFKRDRSIQWFDMSKKNTLRKIEHTLTKFL